MRREVEELFEMLGTYFSYPFVRYAMLVGVLIALSSSLLGVSLVLKRFSFIGDGLSHVAFGAMAVATVLDVGNDTAVVLPVTIGSAILLLRTGQNAKLKGDAVIAMISVGALACGYLFLNLFSKSANLTGDVCSTLFGSTAILTLSITDVWLCIFMSVLVMILFTIFYHRIFAVTFDETFAQATGMNVKRYDLLIAVVTASVIVLAMKLAGSLLISALIIFPALSAMRIFKNFFGVVVMSAVLSVICAASGILCSILASTPVGATVVCMDILAFVLCSLAGMCMKR